MSENVPIIAGPEDLIIVFFIAVICGIIFFVVDLYNENKTREIHSSLIAGISVAYFFLIVLPEISKNMPEFPLHLEMLEFLFVLIGFTFIHVSEKFILQRVDSKAQEKIRQLIKMEKNLDLVETSMGQLIKEQLCEEEIDDYAIKDMARIISELIEQEQTLKEQDHELKYKIQNHINEDLDNIHLFTNFIYHFLVGLILFNLLIIDLLAAILFFIFAIFKALISKTSNDIVLFPDIELHDELKKPEALTYFFALATIIGVLVGLMLEIIFPISLEVLYILFSFISGVILYIIVREVIPEKEKGNPTYFLVGVIAFGIVVLIIRYLGYTLLT